MSSFPAATDSLTLLYAMEQCFFFNADSTKVLLLTTDSLSQKILAGNYSSGAVIEAKVVNNEIAFSGI